MKEKCPHVGDVQNLEIDLLLESIFRRYGHDFRKYSKAHVKRRLSHRQTLNGFENMAAMQHQLLHDKEFFGQLLMDLSINVTEMFRDPPFYKSMREEIIPLLKTWPFVKVWHAGCSTGEEVYSMAMLLKEEGLHSRARIYATDFNPESLRTAKSGVYPVDRIRQYTRNYQDAGGTGSFADYYSAKYENAVLDKGLREQVVFSEHNLVTDGVFGEMNLIFCRNVLIYFDTDLQNRVIKLFADSLCPGGILCLGTKESLQFSEYEDLFDPLVKGYKIYRKRVA